MPLHRRHTISSGASPKKKKPSSGPRVPFLPASDHKLTQLFEDLVWQVEQGVHRIEFLERELRLERATRETAKSTEEDRVERVKRSHAAAMAATHSFLDDERRAFAEERTRLEDCIRANLAAFHALQHDDVPSLIDRPPPPPSKIDRGSQSWKIMADRASSPPPPPGSPPATPPSVKRLRDAARGVSHQMPERPTPKNVDAQLDELRRGLRVVKHGRKGKPRDTWLFLDSHDGLCWVRAGKKGEPPSVQKLSTKRRLCLRPDLDLDVVRGKQTAPLKRNKKAPHYMCLSVVVAAHDIGEDGRRSLDLQVASLERRDALADALEAAVDRAGRRVLAETSASTPRWADDAKVRAVLRRARLRNIPVEGD